MNLSIFYLRQVPYVAWCSYIALLIPVCFYLSINYSCHHVCSNIEFSSIIEHGVSDIALKNNALRSQRFFNLFGIVFPHTSLYSFLDLLYFICALNSIPSIRKFPRFHNPIINDFILSSKLISFQKLFILLILQPLLNMKRQRHNIEQIHFNRFTILLQYIKHRFFIS